MGLVAQLLIHQLLLRPFINLTFVAASLTYSLLLLCFFLADIPNLVYSKEEEIWYGRLLLSIWQCFRLMRVNKLLQVDLEYFFTSLRCTSECLKKLQGRQTNTVSKGSSAAC